MKKNYDVLVVGGAVWEVKGGGAKRPRSVPNARKEFARRRRAFFVPKIKKSGRTVKLKI